MSMLSRLGRLLTPAALLYAADRITRLEPHMAAIQESLSRLTAAVESVASRHADKIADLQEALAAERQAAADLASTEAAEDVAQDQALADARAETDRLLGEVAGSIDEVTEQLNAVGADAADAGEEPAEEPAEEDLPADEEPAEDPLAPAPAEDPQRP